MRIPSRRITKLRKFYKPRATRKRLRLNDKTIRRIERQRIRERTSFDSVYKRHVKDRVNEAEWRLRKRFGITKGAAHTMRETGIKKHLSYAILYELTLPKKIQVEPEPLFTWFLSFYDKILEHQKKYPSAIVEYTSPFYNYTGSLSGFSINQAKRPIDVKYGKDVSPYWGLVVYDLVKYFEQFDDDGILVLLRASLDESRLADFRPIMEG